MTTVPPPLSNGVPAVQTFALTRLYGSMIALNALNLTVNRGDLFTLQTPPQGGNIRLHTWLTSW